MKHETSNGGRELCLSSRVKNYWHKSGTDQALKVWAKTSEDEDVKLWLDLKANPPVRKPRLKIKKSKGDKSKK